MNKLFICIFGIGCVLFDSGLSAQKVITDTTILEEVVISASKFAEKKKNILQKIDVIPAKKIADANTQNTGDLLISTGNVFVQKSQQGGSSPVIRGFEASRVLLVIDGVRMNNAIYRSGHLQNVITIDQNMLERAEVQYGPGSTLFGSDALGGVVHLQTKTPKLAGAEKMLFTGNAFSRYSSVNNEKTIHANTSIGGKKIAWLQAYTYSDFGDMKMGNKYHSQYPSFGRRDSLITNINGRDTVIANKNNRIQKFSGYRQWDIIQKLLFKPNEKATHLLNFQFSNTTDVPRYDRLQDKRNFDGSIGTTLRFAKWNYGPQKRFLGAYEFNISDFAFFNEFKVILNYQDIEESRQQREYRQYDRFDSRKENVSIGGFVVDGRRIFNNNELTIGLDGQLNSVKSRATRINLNTGVVSKLDTRYPDGENKVNYFGLYAQHIAKFKKGKLVLNDGLRIQLISLNSNVVDNSFFNLPVTNFEQNNFALTGNLGLIYLPSAKTRIAAGLSSGFRSPNLDDLVKIFDFSVARRVYVPNADIKPEYTYNVDINFTQQVSEKIKIEITGFYTWFRNAIASAPFQLNGQDSIVYNGINSAIYANQNSNKAIVTGFNTSLKINITEQLSFNSTLTYTSGRMTRFNGIKVPSDHIPPLYGKSSLTYTGIKFSTELFSLYNGWKKIKKYNPDGEDNQQYATPDGMPSWFTVNWKSSYIINDHFTVQAAIENILNRNYRYFASGFSAPGQNILLSLRASW